MAAEHGILPIFTRRQAKRLLDLLVLPVPFVPDDGVEAGGQSGGHDEAPPEGRAVVPEAPVADEGEQNQMQALIDAVGEDGPDKVKAICSDSPEIIDTTGMRDKFPNFVCPIKDPVHIAMKVEQSTGEKKTQFPWVPLQAIVVRPAFWYPCF